MVIIGCTLIVQAGVIGVTVGILKPNLTHGIVADYARRIGDYADADGRFVVLVRDETSVDEWCAEIAGLPWVVDIELNVEGVPYCTREEPMSDQALLTVYQSRMNFSREDLSAGANVLVDMRPVNGVINKVILSTGVGLAIGLLVMTYLLVRLLWGTTRVLESMSTSMQAGALLESSHARAPIRELGIIGHSYNDLIRRVNASTTELENQIDERTQDLSLALTNLRKTETLRTALITSISHNLRTPLTGAMGLIDIMRDETGSLESKAGTLDQVKQQLQVLNGEISILLSSGTPDYEKAFLIGPFNWGTLVDEVVDLTRELAQQADNIVSIAQGDMVDIIHAPRTIFAHILSNLLSNAHRHTRQSSIVICSALSGRELTFSVQDNGPGINGSEGIGLTMVRTWVDHLGGSVDIDSSDKGTVVSVRVPVKLES